MAEHRRLCLAPNEMCSHDEKDTTSINEVIPEFTENLNSSIQG